jgi:hypothetical protein
LAGPILSKSLQGLPGVIIRGQVPGLLVQISPNPFRCGNQQVQGSVTFWSKIEVYVRF